MVCSNTKINIEIAVVRLKKCTNKLIFFVLDYDFSQCITNKSVNAFFLVL